jgi:5-methylcytosine-specific restriction endonuclease McrA
MNLPYKFRQKKPAKKTDRQKLFRKLDDIFSEFIRLRDSDHQGICKCITCGSFDHWRSVDAGHFVTRENMATRWEEENVNAQCQKCNRFKSGKQYEHGLAIDKKHGAGTASKLVIKSKSACNWHDFEIEAMASHYRVLVKELKEQKGMI